MTNPTDTVSERNRTLPAMSLQPSTICLPWGKPCLSGHFCSFPGRVELKLSQRLDKCCILNLTMPVT